MFMVSLVTMLSSLPIGLPADITAEVTVQKNCGIDVDTTTITFTKDGSDLQPGDTSDPQARTITNTGTSGKEECTYEISGSDWIGSPAGSMDSEQTDYKCNSGPGIVCLISTSFKDLPTTLGLGEGPETFLGLDAGVTESIDFQVEIPKNQLAGSYSQIITITLLG